MPTSVPECDFYRIGQTGNYIFPNNNTINYSFNSMFERFFKWFEIFYQLDFVINSQAGKPFSFYKVEYFLVRPLFTIHKGS